MLVPILFYKTRASKFIGWLDGDVLAYNLCRAVLEQSELNE